MTLFTLASKNTHKLAEFQAMLQDCDIRLRPLPADVPESPENGSTFQSNAMEKAAFYGSFCDGWVLADDSGICVDALNGAPGVHSARFAGPNGTDADLRRKLLSAMVDVPVDARTASMVSVVALWNQNLGVGFVAKGEIEGRILTEARGEGGFGYDPLFWLPSLGRTMGELTASEKNERSHRRRALDALIKTWTQYRP